MSCLSCPIFPRHFKLDVSFSQIVPLISTTKATIKEQLETNLPMEKFESGIDSFSNICEDLKVSTAEKEQLYQLQENYINSLTENIEVQFAGSSPIFAALKILDPQSKHGIPDDCICTELAQQKEQKEDSKQVKHSNLSSCRSHTSQHSKGTTSFLTEAEIDNEDQQVAYRVEEVSTLLDLSPGRISSATRIFPHEKVIAVLDSMAGGFVKPNAEVSIEMWTLLKICDSTLGEKECHFVANRPSDLPQQGNDYDCVVFTSLYARCLIANNSMFVELGCLQDPFMKVVHKESNQPAEHYRSSPGAFQSIQASEPEVPLPQVPKVVEMPEAQPEPIGMVNYKGRLGFKQYMPMKPLKCGIKVWVHADATNGSSNKLNILQPPTPEASNSIQAPEPEVPVPQVAKSSCGPEAQPEPKQVPTALTALPNQDLAQLLEDDVVLTKPFTAGKKVWDKEVGIVVIYSEHFSEECFKRAVYFEGSSAHILTPWRFTTLCGGLYQTAKQFTINRSKNSLFASAILSTEASNDFWDNSSSD
ncbi:hypothetical protein AWC38_SpisGene16765 [Stylophora pistillata]|uniref:PiggyBac transposable element-derived protein domain-containing protein n=1 Tax=Stylophora pistillata TaxID=50429 RepID=A0A2B4RPW8_STYPI|nr:hypothetical protein AWC38_SpisGene16765 [Stylophora pistillata]